MNKRNFRNPILVFCAAALFALLFVTKALAEKDNVKDLSAPSNDLPALHELPLEAQTGSSVGTPAAVPALPRLNPTAEVSKPMLEQKVDGLYQTYLKPEPTVDGYVYDPVGRRDPFRPYRDAKVGIGQLVVQRERGLEALENFDVKTLEVVAIIWGITKPKALIQDPNKIIHTVVKGMRIGKNDGVVAEIREGEVVVVELFDQNGKIVKEPYILTMKK